MFTFTANFKDNDIYLEGKKAFLTNEVLVEILNSKVPNLKGCRETLVRELPQLDLFGNMEIFRIEQYNSHVQKAQGAMRLIDNYFNQLSIASHIASSSQLHAEKLVDVLNTKPWIWETGDTDEVEDALLYSDDFSNEYGFNHYVDTDCGEDRHHFYITKFEPWDLKEQLFDYEMSADLEELNTAIKNLFERYITFIDDILRVKEVYVDFIDNYLNAEHKFLDNNALAQRFTAFLKKYDSSRTTPYLNFTSGYGMFSHSVLTDVKGKSILCKTYKFRSLGAFLYYDLFSGIETNYLPKRCENCGQYFLIQSGKYTDYCERTAPQDSTKTCREVGARKRYDDKCKNDPVWQGYNRAYKAHYARYMKKKMTVSEFEQWASWAIQWRTKAENDEISIDEYLSKIKK